MRLRVHAPALIGLAAACAPSEPVPLPWAIDFAAGAPRPPEVATVRAWIRTDGCSGTPVYSVVVSASAPTPPEPPRLDNGTWWFGADALDARCRIVASACAEVVVPSARSVQLALTAVDPPSAGCAAASHCLDGMCAPSDGGSADGGPVDGGGGDAGDGGGGRDGGRDLDAGSLPDATVCTGCFSAGECVPGTSDSACGRFGEPCESCTGGRCASNGQCCNGCLHEGSCRSGASSARCGTGGATCVNCNDTGQTCVSGTCT